MFRIFAPKANNRVVINRLREKNLHQELTQAKGVMDNYMKDKHFTVNISQCPLDDEFVQLQAMSDSKMSLSCISVRKNGEKPFLRKVYSAIEMFAKDSLINKK
jgi:hypothetical protein